MVEEKNMDVVNRKTQEPERIRVIGEEETKRIEDGCACACAWMDFGWSILIFSLVYFSYVK